MTLLISPDVPAAMAMVATTAVLVPPAGGKDRAGRLLGPRVVGPGAATRPHVRVVSPIVAALQGRSTLVGGGIARVLGRTKAGNGVPAGAAQAVTVAREDLVEPATARVASARRQTVGVRHVGRVQRIDATIGKVAQTKADVRAAGVMVTAAGAIDPQVDAAMTGASQTLDGPPSAASGRTGLAGAERTAGDPANVVRALGRGTTGVLAESSAGSVRGASDAPVANGAGSAPAMTDAGQGELVGNPGMGNGLSDPVETAAVQTVRGTTGAAAIRGVVTES